MGGRGAVRIFVVEDSPAFVEAIVNLISGVAGLTVIGSAGEAPQATADIQRLHPDVVTLDLNLARGSGLDVLRSIKSAGEKSPLVIVFTSATEPGYRRACQRLGADFLFDKSTDYDRMAELLKSLTAPTEISREG